MVGVVLFLAAAPAAAHATLVAASPGDGAQLAEAPEEVRLEFSEPVSVELGGLRVFAEDGDRVDEGETRAEGDEIAVDLTDLDDGAYVVTYRVVSQDGHPVQGGLVFSVGDATADPALLAQFFDEGEDRFWAVVGAALRFLAYAGVLLAAGGALFLALVHDRGDDERPLRHLVAAAAFMGAIGLLAALPVQAALATGTGIGAITEDGVLTEILADGVGLTTAAGLVGLGILLVGRRRAVVGAGVVVAAGAFALSGHTRSADAEVLAVVAAAVHGVVAAAWFGGLAFLGLTVAGRADEPDRTATAGVVARFSRLATVAVLAVGVTGVALTWSEVGTVEALTSTTYGWTLLAKVAVVAVVALIGAHNRLRVVPAIVAGTAERAWRLLRTSVALEAGALVLAIALTAVLVNLTPARTEAGVGALFSETVALADAGSGEEVGTVNVVVDPNRVGRNTIHLYFYGPDGRPADLAEDVTLRLSLPADDIGPIEREPVRAGDAHLQVVGDELATSGRWVIEVDARLSRFTAASGQVEVLVGP